MMNESGLILRSAYYVLRKGCCAHLHCIERSVVQVLLVTVLLLTACQSVKDGTVTDVDVVYGCAAPPPD